MGLVEVGEPNPENIQVRHVGDAPADPMTTKELKEANKSYFQELGRGLFGPFFGKIFYLTVGRHLLNRHVKKIQQQAGEAVQLAGVIFPDNLPH